MKRVIVTGATGFVGANVARRLIADGHDVTLFVRADSDRWRLSGIEKDARLVDLHLDDYAAVLAAVGAARPDWVFHLAVHGAYSWQTDWQRMVSTNVVGTMNLVEACLKTGFSAFVNTGSSSEYGFKDHAPSEDEFVDPNSYYAVTKANATQYCRFIARDRQVNLTTLRLYSVFGPYEDPNRLVPTVLVRGLDGELPPLVDPSVARDYIHVDDVVDAYLQVATTAGIEPGAVFNIGTGVQTSIASVVEIARRRLGIAVQPSWGSMENRRWDTSIWVADTKVMRAATGFSPKLSFEEGFARFAQWIAGEPARRAYYAERIPGARSASGLAGPKA